MNEDRSAKPWDLLNKNIGRVEQDIAENRMDICRSCEHFLKVTGQCKKCGCIMAMKTKLPNATCPVEKW
jgi:tRNA(Ile2) C34 agmatinyltransferase TiaS